MSEPLSQSILEAISEATLASHITSGELIQELWSGYGQIRRVILEGGSHESLVLKQIQLPDVQDHPRGWATSRSHERKVRSYEVETHWYRFWSHRCDLFCRVPKLISELTQDGSQVLVLEDLDAAGFSLRLRTPTQSQMCSCLHWLAEFHATFMNESPEGLWETGTYWHLDTRPDELAALTDLRLKKAAPHIDARLTNARFQSFVHGDAKLANFCFSNTSERVAAVDFQYVGGGCGIKDVAYFLGSCLSEEALSRQAHTLLEIYFQSLTEAIDRKHPQMVAQDVVEEWRELFPWAWADFYRFLQGWSPGHWKLNMFSEQIAESIIAKCP